MSHFSGSQIKLSAPCIITVDITIYFVSDFNGSQLHLNYLYNQPNDIAQYHRLLSGQVHSGFPMEPIRDPYQRDWLPLSGMGQARESRTSKGRGMIA